MKKTIGLALIALPVAVLLLSVSLGMARADGPLVFGIRPARAIADDPRSGAYFSYTLQPGATASDEAVVINSGEAPVALKLYAADGITAINGGTAFDAANANRTGVRSWLSTNVSELNLSKGQRTTVPFAVRVPPDARPGDHVAGWVVEAPPRAADGMGATVVERVGVAVVVRVPGPTRSELSIDSVCLNQASGSNYVQVKAHNSGNVLTKGKGTLTISPKAEKQWSPIPVELGSVLPGDETLLRADLPQQPAPGEYLAAISLDLSDGQQVQSSAVIVAGSDTANGCQAVLLEEQGPAAPGTGGESAETGPDGGGFPILVITLGALLPLVAGVLAILALQRRRAAAHTAAGSSASSGATRTGDNDEWHWNG